MKELQELNYETNEQNVMRYIQIKKIENISSKKIQAIAIYLFPTLYLRN